MKLFLEENAYDKYKRELDKKLFDDIEALNPNKNEKGITEWLVRQFYKYTDNLFTYKDKIKISLERFEKLKRTKNIEEPDINKYDLNKLFAVTKDEVISGKEKKKENLKGAQKIYEDDTWLLLIPRTYESACHYGGGTKWCTSSKTKRDKYDEYMNIGYLMFLINKKNPKEKYSMNKERASFVDASDNEMNVKKIKLLLDKLPKSLSSIIEKEGSSITYKLIKDKILGKQLLDNKEMKMLDELSNASKNKLLKIIMVQYEDDIFHVLFKQIAQKTLRLDHNLKATAGIVEDKFYEKELKKII